MGATSLSAMQIIQPMTSKIRNSKAGQPSKSASRASAQQKRTKAKRKTTLAPEIIDNEENHLTISMLETDTQKRRYLSTSFAIDNATLEKLQQINAQTTQSKLEPQRSGTSTGSARLFANQQDSKTSAANVTAKNSHSSSAQNSVGGKHSNDGYTSPIAKKTSKVLNNSFTNNKLAASPTDTSYHALKNVASKAKTKSEEKKYAADLKTNITASSSKTHVLNSMALATRTESEGRQITMGPNIIIIGSDVSSGVLNSIKGSLSETKQHRIRPVVVEASKSSGNVQDANTTEIKSPNIDLEVIFSDPLLKTSEGSKTRKLSKNGRDYKNAAQQINNSAEDMINQQNIAQTSNTSTSVHSMVYSTTGNGAKHTGKVNNKTNTSNAYISTTEEINNGSVQEHTNMKANAEPTLVDAKTEKHVPDSDVEDVKKSNKSSNEKVLHLETENKVDITNQISEKLDTTATGISNLNAILTTPSDALFDNDAGASVGSEMQNIQEEWFTSTEVYKQSINDTKQWLLLKKQGPRKMSRRHEATETADIAKKIASAAAQLHQVKTSEDWSSSTDDMAGSAGDRRRRRKSHRSSSAGQSHEQCPKHSHWKRQKSAKAYLEYLQRTDPRCRSDDEQSVMSGKSSVYPATSSEMLQDKDRLSDVSSEKSESTARLMAEKEHTAGECNTSKDAIHGDRVTVATSTTDMNRTEGTQTLSEEYVMLDRRSCLVKVLAALQRLNTDEALQVARILRRSLEEDRRCRAYEDADVRRLPSGRQSLMDATQPPAIRTESDKAVANLPSETLWRSDIAEQDYDEMTRIVSQIDLMVRSKLRITAAPYSLIYETLINYHLEITQDHAPSVAVFNYYLTEQGHPLFDDTSGFSRPTILQLARESLRPHLYAHAKLEAPRQLPDNTRLLDLQLFVGELLICPFCGRDLVWGQYQMCAEFCCDEFAELITTEYEADLGRIRRQEARRRHSGSLLAASCDSDELMKLPANEYGSQPPAKISCQVDQKARLRSIQRYGQEGKAGAGALALPSFTMDMEKKVSKATKPTAMSERANRRKLNRDERQKRHKQTDRDRRFSSEPNGKRRRGSRRQGRHSSWDPMGDALVDDGKSKRRGKKHRGVEQSPDVTAELQQMEALLGRKLTEDEVNEIMNNYDLGFTDSAQRLSITTTGVRGRAGLGSMAIMLDHMPSKEESSRQAADEGQPSTDITSLTTKIDSGSADADDEAGDDSSNLVRPIRAQKVQKGRRGRRKTHWEMDRIDGSETFLEMSGRTTSKTSRDKHTSVKSKPERWDYDSAYDDQMRYRLSDSVFLVSGVTIVPSDVTEPTLSGQQAASGDEESVQAPVQLRPVDSGFRQFLQETYPSGKVFVTWFDDGSGHVLYPAGEPAILITHEDIGRRFVVLPNEPCATATPNCVLAMFDPRGFGFVYSETGTIKLLFNQNEGWYRREDGSIRQWHWSDLDNHINHSPILQPIIFAISRYVSVRVIRQDYIILSYWANRRSARFNVGVTSDPMPAAAATAAADLESPPRYRLQPQPAERRRLTELTEKVRLILTDMSHLTDEPARYIIENITTRDLRRGMRQPARPGPKWVASEPRHPNMPDGISMAHQRRVSASEQAQNSARHAYLLMRMQQQQQQQQQLQHHQLPQQQQQQQQLQHQQLQQQQYGGSDGGNGNTERPAVAGLDAKMSVVVGV